METVITDQRILGDPDELEMRISDEVGLGELLREYCRGDFLAFFEDLRAINEGGEGTIIRARRRFDGAIVALKKYFRGKIKTVDDWQNSEIAAGREMNFLKRAARDGIENVPKILGFGTTGLLNEPVIAMEYIKGKTLDAIIGSHGFISDIDEVIRIAKEVAKPLRYAHERLNGFVHRDIKPANIMITEDGKVKVLDWSTVRDKGLTLKNTQLYSPNYTAPEVLEGRSVTAAADIYSLGKTLEHCLLGSLFEEKDGNVTKRDFEDRKIPPHIINALMKATREDPSERYQSIDDFLHDLCEQPVQRKNESSQYHHALIVRGNQYFGIGINYAHEVHKGQYAFLAVVNYTHETREQFGLLVANCARRVNELQGGSLVAINHAHEVQEQFGFLAAINYARKAHKYQAGAFAAINYAHEFCGYQGALFTFCAINVAKRASRGQYGPTLQQGLINIATERLEGKQIGIINYAPRRGRYKQFGLLNIRPGKKWWNPEISFFYHRSE
jgi:serine/threonine protein kinase